MIVTCYISEPWFSQEVPQRGLFVDGLSREYVTCAADVMAVIRAGAVMELGFVGLVHG